MIYFNPRAPCGARHPRGRLRAVYHIFQSTRPVWGATVGADQQRVVVGQISIHAPRVGRDGAHAAGRERGCTISIHAPRVGRDGTGSSSAWCSANFNPRAPCGARPYAMWPQIEIAVFQSTRPVWGATVHRLHRAILVHISIHAPRVGRDERTRSARSMDTNFNPRAPCGARRPGLLTAPRSRHFNPRAPCGARHSLYSMLCGAFRFQSTRPVWGATRLCMFLFDGLCISIHAPRVGRDLSSFASIRNHCDFNPRAPCGARRCD